MTWEVPDDWMDWARKRAEDRGVDLDAPIRDTAGDWSRPNPVEGHHRMVIFAREIAVRNNALQRLGDEWEPDEDQNVRIWQAGISVLPMRVFHTYSDSARDDMCSVASSLMWHQILKLDKVRDFITPDVFFRRILQAARNQMSKGITVPAELWGDVCEKADEIATGHLFHSNPEWLAMRKDHNVRFNLLVDSLVDTWVSMLGLFGKSNIDYNKPGHIDRHRQSYRYLVLNCIKLTRKIEEWQDDPLKN